MFLVMFVLNLVPLEGFHCKRIMKAETSTTGDVPFLKIGTFGKEPDAYISEKFEEYKAAYAYPKGRYSDFCCRDNPVERFILAERMLTIKTPASFGLRMMSALF